MGLSVGPQSFRPPPGGGSLQKQDGQPEDSATANPLDPLVAALGRAVERSARGARSGDTPDGRD